MEHESLEAILAVVYRVRSRDGCTTLLSMPVCSPCADNLAKTWRAGRGRIRLLKSTLTFFAISALFGGHALAAESRTNVLFIALDDLNDWIGCLGGHPQTKTPNLDRLAASGVLFRNAYTEAASFDPFCTANLRGL